MTKEDLTDALKPIVDALGGLECRMDSLEKKVDAIVVTINTWISHSGQTIQRIKPIGA